jgi:hypothetical protein
MNNKLKTIALALLLSASVAACKKKGDGAAAGGGIGVPECDDYFARMDACAKKLDKTSGEGLTKMANMMRGAWKEEAADAEKKKALPAVCKTAVKDMAKQVPDCDWGVAPEPKPDTGSGSAGSADMGGSGSAAAPEGSAGSGSAAAPAGSAGSGSAGSATP